MKLKKLWIPALLLLLIGGIIKVCDTMFNVNGTGFVLSSTACNLTLAGCAVLLYIIGWCLSLADRNKTFKAEPTKNMLCGIFGFIAAVSLLGGGVVRLIADKNNLVESILAILAGLVLLYEACISFTGVNGMKKIPVAALIVPVWCCTRFIMLFIEYSKRSLMAVELFDIIALAFLVMFLFYQSMYFAAINNRLAIRKAAIYGTVFIMLELVVCADLIIKMAIGRQPMPNIDTQIVEPTMLNIVMIVGDLALCCYAFFFIREILKTADNNLTWPAEKNQDDLLLAELDEDIAAQETTGTETAAEENESEDKATDNSRDTSSADEDPPMDISTAVTTMDNRTEPENDGAFPGVVSQSSTKSAPDDKKSAPKNDAEAYGELLTMLDKMKDS